MNIIILIIFGVIILWMIILVPIKRIKVKRTKEVLDRFRGQKILGATPSACFFGLESLGMMQVRGNGVLVLTENELYFQMWVPKKEFNIPIVSIVTIETTRTHCGKGSAFRLLKIVFKDEKGKTDSIAWVVKNLSNWKDTLERLIQKDTRHSV